MAQHTKSDSESPPRKRTKLNNKPLIERRRRERINKSLSEIKELVLQDGKTEEMNASKMEKADILEMTVKHLREKNMASNSDALDRYRAGYMASLQTTLDYLNTNSNLSKDVQMNLAQAISCRMLQYKKCQMISVKSQYQPQESTVCNGTQTSPLLSNGGAFFSHTPGRDEYSRGCHGINKNIEYGKAGFGPCLEPLPISCTLNTESASDNNSSSRIQINSNTHVIHNEDSGFLDDKMSVETFTSNALSNMPAGNSQGHSNRTRASYYYHPSLSQSKCSSEVWRPW